MSKKVKALFVVVTLSATFIILFQTCVITLDPRSCPMDTQNSRQYLQRYSNAFPLSFITARAPLWIQEKNLVNLTQAINNATLLKLNESAESLRSSADTQLTALNLNSSKVKPSGTGSSNSDGSIVPGELLASMEQTAPHRPGVSTDAHTAVRGELPQSIATFPVELATKNDKVVLPQPDAKNENDKMSSVKSLQSADGQSDAVGSPVMHPRPSSHPPLSGSSKQLQTHTAILRQLRTQQLPTQRTSLPQQQTQRAQPKTQTASLAEHQTQRASVPQPRTQKTSLPQQQTSLPQRQTQRPEPKKQLQRPSLAQTHPTPKTSQKRRRSKQREAAILSGPLPTKVSSNLSLSSISHLPLPRMGTYTCRDRLCTELLTPVDLLYFNYCTDRQKRAKMEIYHNMPLGKCHFIDGRNRSTVALVSFPGSGNTWVRGLLEQATGVCTGAIYCDVSLRASGFNGEGVRSGAVIAVKTHRPVPLWTEGNVSVINKRGAPQYGSGILVIRNPFDALVAEWNREKSKMITVTAGNGTSRHVTCAGRAFFGDNAAWNEHITRKVYVWQNYFYNWLLNNVSKPILVVRFEDLKTDLIGQMKRMLDFVQLPYMEDDLRSRLSEGFDKFQRIHDGEDFKHFTAQQREFVKSVVLETIKTLRLHGQKNMLLGLTDYLFTDL